MKTKKIEARQIGWVVEWKDPTRDRWDRFIGCRACESKSTAIWDFEGRCLLFYFIPHKIKKSKSLNAKYRWLKKNGLARCVAVYVEVSDEA